MINYIEENFLRAINFTLKAEGIISDDPNDTGGLTVFGIASRWYPDLVKKLKALIDEGKVNEAKEIAIDFYRINYWIKMGCEKLEYPLDICVFNCSVNCGESRAKKLLKESQNWKDYLFKQIEFYVGLESFKYFGKGWINRTINLFNTIKKEESVNEYKIKKERWWMIMGGVIFGLILAIVAYVTGLFDLIKGLF